MKSKRIETRDSLRIAIVSNERQWEIKQIGKAARQRKHSVKVFSPEEVLVDTFGKKEFDIALFRVLSGQATLGRAAAASLYAKSMPIVDEKIAFRPGGNKFDGCLAFQKAGLNIPKTLVLNKAAVKELKKWPGEIVFKPIGGKRGQEIYKCTAKDLKETLARLRKGKVYLAQEFIPFEKEFRVLVLDGKVLGVMKKESADWRHNIARGAIPSQAKVDAKLKKMALKAAKAVSLEFAGVDVAVSKGRYYLLEANRSPQFKAFQSVHQKSVALEVVKYLEKKVGRK